MASALDLKWTWRLKDHLHTYFFYQDGILMYWDRESEGYEKFYILYPQSPDLSVPNAVYFRFDGAEGLSGIVGTINGEQRAPAYTGEELRKELLPHLCTMDEEELEPDVIAQTEADCYNAWSRRYGEIAAYAEPLFVPPWPSADRAETVLAKQGQEPPLGIARAFADAWWRFWMAELLSEPDGYSAADSLVEWGEADETPGAEEPFAAFDFYQTPSLSCTW